MPATSRLDREFKLEVPLDASGIEGFKPEQDVKVLIVAPDLKTHSELAKLDAEETRSVSFETFNLRFSIFFCARRLGLSLPGQDGDGEAVLSASAEGDKITSKQGCDGQSRSCLPDSLSGKWSQLRGEIAPYNFGSLVYQRQIRWQ